MAILGNNTVDADFYQDSTGRKYATPATLATDQYLQELHAMVQPSSSGTGGSQNYVLHIHADSSGAPGALLAYTGILGPYSGATKLDISQAGFNVPLPAGIYWLGISFQNDIDGNVRASTANTTSPFTYKAQLGPVAFSPPSNPFGTPDTTGGSNTSFMVWAVVGASSGGGGSAGGRAVNVRSASSPAQGFDMRTGARKSFLFPSPAEGTYPSGLPDGTKTAETGAGGAIGTGANSDKSVVQGEAV